MVTQVVMLGVDHRAAPVALRERLAIAPARLREALAALRATPGFSEAVVLSTCNRVELYAVAEDVGAAREALLRFLCAFQQVAEAEVSPVAAFRHGREAVRHLFRVAASLDSMIVGETQVISQVKEAYLAAAEAGTAGGLLHPVFQKSLHAAKRAHEETAIGDGRVSVSSVAVDFAKRVFQRIEDRTTLVLGAGETAELVVKQLQEEGVKRWILANRDRARAEALSAEFGGKGVTLDEVPLSLPEADVVIACLSVAQPFLTREWIADAIAVRGGEPVLLLDLGVPRNVDPRASEMEGAFLYTIDDLQSVVLENLAEREKEMTKCEAILDHELAETAARSEALPPVISRLSESLHGVGKEELDRSLSRLSELTPAGRAEVADLVRRVVNKILHPPISELKKGASNGEASALAETLKRLFHLE